MRLYLLKCIAENELNTELFECVVLELKDHDIMVNQVYPRKGDKCFNIFFVMNESLDPVTVFEEVIETLRYHKETNNYEIRLVDCKSDMIIDMHLPDKTDPNVDYYRNANVKFPDPIINHTRSKSIQ